LDKRIAMIFEKKQQLLEVLNFPQLPLHNNASELAARVQARTRDVSLHTMSENGTQIKEAFMTLSQTALKLGVRTYEYVYDRLSGRYQMPSLAELIRQQALAEQG